MASAERFVARLQTVQSDAELAKIQRYFKSGAGEYGAGDTFLGVRMGDVFALAKEFIDLPPVEIERLLESPLHEVRAGGLSVMDKQARRKTIRFALPKCCSMILRTLSTRRWAGGCGWRAIWSGRDCWPCWRRTPPRCRA